VEGRGEVEVQYSWNEVNKEYASGCVSSLAVPCICVCVCAVREKNKKSADWRARRYLRMEPNGKIKVPDASTFMWL
jgi:hypothetical protein